MLALALHLPALDAVRRAPKNPIRLQARDNSHSARVATMNPQSINGHVIGDLISYQAIVNTPRWTSAIGEIASEYSNAYLGHTGIARRFLAGESSMHEVSKWHANVDALGILEH